MQARTEQTMDIRRLEGRNVSVSLQDGTRIDDCSLVSSGRNRLDTLWLFVDGDDVFVARSNVIDIWESASNRPWAA